MIYPNSPVLGDLEKFGKWWWFYDKKTMKSPHPVQLIIREDKIHFRHPFPFGLKDEQNVVNWVSSFLGPCLMKDNLWNTCNQATYTPSDQE